MTSHFRQHSPPLLPSLRGGNGGNRGWLLRKGLTPQNGTVRINPLPFPLPTPSRYSPPKGQLCNFLSIVFVYVCICVCVCPSPDPTPTLRQGPKFLGRAPREECIWTRLAPPLKQGTRLLATTQGSGSKLKSSPSPPSMRSLMMLSMSHSRFSIYISRSRS